MARADFVIVGGGWRAEFYLRVARELPERFRVCGMLVRDPAKAARLESTWGIPTHRSLDDLLRLDRPLFAVVSVPWAVSPAMLSGLSDRKIPCLAETPPAPDVPGLAEVNALTDRGARIQVAEQYIFQPLHAARLAIANSGLLGVVSQAQISAAHGYHGISLLRHFLSIRYAPVKITARSFGSSIVQSCGRGGPPAQEQIVASTQTLAWFDFGDRLGVFDFTGDQYFSHIRSHRLLVRGLRGEINQSRIRHLLDFRTPMEFELERRDAGLNGNLEGYYHKGIVGGGRSWYENPFRGARLSDDELAVATLLSHMADFARGGADFYSLAEASYDHYLNLMLDQSLSSGKTVECNVPPWAK